MTADDTEDRRGFVSRWAQRKAQARRGAVPAAPPVPSPAVVPVASAAARVGDAAPVAPVATVANPPAAEPGDAARAAVPATEAPPTLADVAALTRASDYSRFVAPGVDEGVKHAAMKKLFADPHFNVMDGLDTYIADYGQPDPIPLAMLRRMNQSRFLGLFERDAEDADADAATDAATETATTTESLSPSDDHADLRLQQDDAAGRPEPDQGARA